MLSAMDTKTILHAKVTCCTLLSIAISLVSFVAFAITVSVADILMGAPYFLNFQWLVCLICSLCPLWHCFPWCLSVGNSLGYTAAEKPFKPWDI